MSKTLTTTTAPLTRLLFLACLALITGCGESIEVVKERGLDVFENGTRDDVVLDCPYTLEEADHSGLHVKWFQKDNPLPVYRWIHSEDIRQAFGALEGRVDLKYEASQDDYHRHRALHILRPTTDIAGEYHCRVSSFNDEKDYFHELLIYTQPRGVRVWTEPQEDKKVKVMCHVEYVYPQPKLQLSHKSSQTPSAVLENVKEVSSFRTYDGNYNTTVEKVVEEDTLSGPTDFKCRVTIPGTDVLEVTTTKYQPRVEIKQGKVISGCSETNSAMAVVGGLALLLLWRL